MQRRDILRNEIIRLQNEFGIKLYNSKKLNSIDECRNAIYSIAREYARLENEELREQLKISLKTNDELIDLLTKPKKKWYQFWK